jgi:hypothetical protein
VIVDGLTGEQWGEKQRPRSTAYLCAQRTTTTNTTKLAPSCGPVDYADIMDLGWVLPHVGTWGAAVAAALASGVGCYALGVYAATLGGALPVGYLTPPLMAGLRASLPTIYFHALASGAALAVGALQALPSFRRWASLTTHRRLGRLYAGCAVVGSISGAVLSFRAVGGAVSTAGFFLLAVGWLGTTAAAVAGARAHDVPRHAYWAAHSMGLACAAVTLRVYLPLALVPGADFASVYRVIAWACWVPNVLVVEAAHRFRWGRGGGGGGAAGKAVPQVLDALPGSLSAAGHAAAGANGALTNGGGGGDDQQQAAQNQQVLAQTLPLLSAATERQ